MHKKLLLGLIGTIIAGHAFAETTTQTIPTQSYVDTNFQSKIPAGTHGANNTVVTYGANSGDVQERLILYPSTGLNDGRLSLFLADGLLFRDGQALVTSYKNRENITDEQFNNSLVSAKYIANAFEQKQNLITPGTTGSVAIFNGTTGNNGSAKFTERAIYDGSTTYDSTTDADKLITAGAVDNKQNKMTCTRWLDNAEHTDENCLLWQLNN